MLRSITSEDTQAQAKREREATIADARYRAHIASREYALACRGKRWDEFLGCERSI